MVRFERARLLDPTLPASVREARATALDVAEAALAAVDPGPATRRALRGIEGPAHLFALGKASRAMAAAALEAFEIASGVVVGPVEAPELSRAGLDVLVGGHPDPAPDAGETGSRVLDWARGLGAADHVVALVSGGGSAMLERPREGVSLGEVSRAIRALREAGAAIDELNAVRRGLSAIKGGGLAAAIAPARVTTIVVSDVPGHPPAVVASGPTLPPPAGPDPRDVLAAHGVALSPAARAALDAPRAVVTPGEVRVAADGATACAAAVEAARTHGVGLAERPGTFAGEARELGAALTPGAWVWSGETTVTVRGPGRGGRNLEVALAALAAGWRHGTLIALATDGVDGASDFAGALVDATAAERSKEFGLDPARALADNDAHPFFAALGAALVTGPTGTNVADLLLALP